MKKYTITEHFRARYTFVIEAIDELNAEELAEELLNKMAEEEFRQYLEYERETDIPLRIEEDEGSAG